MFVLLFFLYLAQMIAVFVLLSKKKDLSGKRKIARRVVAGIEIILFLIICIGFVSEMFDGLLDRQMYETLGITNR